MPRKAKRSRKRPSRGISNLMVHASSEGHSISMEPPLQPSKLAEPSMPHKTKRTTKRVRRVTHNLISHASSQGHSASMEPPLQHSEMAQPCAPTITIIPPLLPTTQNTVSPLDPSSHTLSRKVKLSKKRVTFGTSNSVPHASSQKYSVLMEPPVQPSELAQPCAPNSTLIPPSIPIAQDPILLSDPPSRAKPRKTKYSNKRVHHGTSNLMPHTSSQGHSTPVETLPKSCTPAITFVPSSIPTAHNLVSPSAAPSSMPRKAKLSRELASLGISNFMPRASSQGHSTYMETLQPSLVAQSCAPSIAPTPPSIATVQSVVSPLDQPLRTMPRRGKLSRERASLGISNMMPNASSHGHSPHMVETPPQPSQVAQSCAPTTTLVPSSSPTAQNLVSPSDPLLHTVPSKNVFSGILNLMHRASYQGQSIPVESSQQSSKPAQTCAPTTTDTLPSIPTAEDLVSPLDLPSCLRPCKSKHFKKRVLRGISNLMLHPSSQGHSIPMEPPLQPLELPRSCAPLIALIPSSSPIGQDPASSSPSDPSQDPVSSSPSDPSQDLVSGSPSDQTQDLVSGSPSDPPTHSISHTFVSPSTITQQALAPNFHPHAGRQWTVQAIDEHGNSKKIQVTKPGVFGMPPGQRIIVPFDRQLRAFGEASTLLSAACGRIVTDSKNIPINFDSWPKVPKSYKDDCFNILKALFHFQTSESIAKRYCLLTMSRKYRNGKLNLWTRAFDPSLSREQLIAKVPDGIKKDQWLSFVDNHLKPEYQELCRKNAELRRKQTIPHTGGSKLLSRKQHEMEVELGRTVGRVELYIATHQKKDGSYVNEEARSIGEKMTEEMSKCANSTEISANDALAKVLGQDHSGRVHCLGLGGLHSVAFQSTARFSGVGSMLLADSTESSHLKEEVGSLNSKLAASEKNVKTLLAYIQMKEGHIPAELGALFDTSIPAEERGGQDMSTSQTESSLQSGSSSQNGSS